MGRRKAIASINLALSLLLTFSYINVPVLAKAKQSKDAPGQQMPQMDPNVKGSDSSQQQVPDSAPQTIKTLEQRLFFKTFPEEALEARLARIEKRVYGQAMEEAADQRVSRLGELLAQQLEDERKRKEQEDAQKKLEQAQQQRQQQQQQQEAVKKQPVVQDPAELKRVAAQAAREQEIENLINQGTELYRQKRGQEAQQKFQAALRLDPHNASAYFSMGIIYEAMGDMPKALSSYQSAAKEEPGNPEFRDAVTALQKKANDKSGFGFRPEIKQLAEQANAAWKRGEFISALDLYLQLDMKEPNRALVKYNIGSIYLMMKDQMNALDYYKQAVALDRNEPRYKKALEELQSEYKKAEKDRSEVQRDITKQFEAAQQQAAQPQQQGQQKQDKKSKKVTQQSAMAGIQSAMQKASGGKLPNMMPQGMPRQTAPNMSMPPQQNSGNMSGWQTTRPQQNMGMQMQMPQQSMGGMPQQQMQMGMPQQQMQMGMPQQQMQMGMPQQQMNMGMQPQQQMQMPQQQMMGMQPQQQMQMPQQPMQNMGMQPQQQMQMQQQPMQMQQQVPQQMAMNRGPQSLPPPQTSAPKLPSPTGVMPQAFAPQGRSPYAINPGVMNQVQGTSAQPGGVMSSLGSSGQTNAMAKFGLIGRAASEGVTVTNVGMASRAAQAGIIAGDEIRAVDGYQVSKPEDINTILGEKVNSPQRVPVLIMRGGSLAVVNM